MNTQEYIQSGILESYVLGLASDEERREVEDMCARYPEILQSRLDFEKALEEQAFANAVQPAPNVKANMLALIANETEAPSITAKEEAPVKKMYWLRYAAAACAILLAGSVYYNIVLSDRNKALRKEYDDSVTALNNIKEDIQVLQQNNNVKMAALNGTPASPQSFTTVYWDTTSHDVYLLINNLPKPASDKQYQLWAFLDGKPVDMGLIEITDKPLQLYKCNKAQNAQGFAITLEKRGREDVSVPGGDVMVVSKL
ncbi:MAG: anti-sigma factor [Bacteroidetes bacterium]|nr:anti-sigma factor [Bacteroidota bacterium]